MLKVTDAYREAITAERRRMRLQAMLDLVSPDIVYGAVSTPEAMTYSRTAQLYDKDIYGPAKYATLEHNRWVLDGSWGLFPSTLQEVPEEAELGFASQAMSGEDGSFAVEQVFLVNFSGVARLQTASVYFPDISGDGVAADFTVDILDSTGAVLHSETYTGNMASKVVLEGFDVASPTAIRLTVTRWTLPGRRCRVIEIVPGLLEEWGNDEVAGLDVTQQVDVSCCSLPYGTAILTIDNASRRFEPRNKGGIFESIEERQGIPIRLGPVLPDGSVELKQLGIFYQYSGGWRTGDNGLTIEWTLVDILGLLSRRPFLVPEDGTLPSTLEGWIAECVGQLGTNFASRYRIHEGYGSKAVTAALANIQGRTCGDILRMACMAAGCYPFADAASGDLAAEPMWASGNRVTLDNLGEYPVMRANDDIAYVQIKIYGEGETTVAKFSGTSAASNNTVAIDNPFIHTRDQALTAARAIISTYGGNRVQLSGRGDPASECGDVDSVQLSESAATSARRIEQKFTFRGGVLADLPSVLLQADGTLLYNRRAVLTGAGQWTVPAGVTTVLAILVSGGDAGTDGTDGSFDGAGTDGADGLGGKVLAQSLPVNPGAVLAYACGSGGAAPGGLGTATTFATLSSARGTRYNGYTDIRSGDVYGRDGVQLPLDGSGDGGIRGLGGNAGKQHTVRTKLYIGDGDPDTDEDKDNFIPWDQTVVDIQPGKGSKGVSGGAGCVVLWWEEDAT